MVFPMNHAGIAPLAGGNTDAPAGGNVAHANHAAPSVTQQNMPQTTSASTMPLMLALLSASHSSPTHSGVASYGAQAPGMSQDLQALVSFIQGLMLGLMMSLFGHRSSTSLLGLQQQPTAVRHAAGDPLTVQHDAPTQDDTTTTDHPPHHPSHHAPTHHPAADDTTDDDTTNQDDA